MQWAVIANLRKRIPGVEFLGITLSPEETRRRLAIEAFPLAGVSHAYYGLSESAGSLAARRQFVKPGRLRRWLKAIPGVGGVLRAIRTCGMELGHIVAAARQVQKLDRVIIPGGGALDDFWGGPWGQPWALFKFGLLCRIYRVPFLFVSIGKCSLDRTLSRIFVAGALRLADYRSFRDPESKSRVQTLADVHNDPVYPDLAFSYPCSVGPTPLPFDRHSDRLTVGVNPIAHCDPRVSPLNDQRRYAAYLARLAETVKWLLQQDHRILFFTTDGGDAAAVKDIQALISDNPMNADRIETLPTASEQSVDDFLRGISRVDMTIASRLHAVILSHLNATPVLALSFDPKVDAHMKAVEQKDYCLDIDNWEAETLITRFIALKSARECEREHLRSFAVRFRRELEAQYDRISDIGSSGPMAHESQSQSEDLRQVGIGSVRGN